jgi:hypothetical protein
MAQRMPRNHKKTYIFFIFLLVSVFSTRSNSGSMRDYSPLLEFIALEDQEDPLYPFDDFQEEMDMESHLANVAFFEKHQELLESVRHDLPGEDIQYRLEGLERRLLFVPETRQLYATLYESYCKDVVNEVLEKTGLKNPFIRIASLLNERPDISESENGVSAYLVHNLVKEYVAAYVFSGRGSRQVRVEVKGQEFVGEVGSFTTDVLLEDDGRLTFARAPFTIWQNSARNPYTALMVPAEETLHIALRDVTEMVIRGQMETQPVKDVETLREIVDEWIAVEEGVVGGLVNILLPEILERFMPGLVPQALMIQDVEEKSKFHKYRYLKAGVSLARQMGHRKWLGMFQVAPKQVRALLKERPSVASLPPG